MNDNIGKDNSSDAPQKGPMSYKLPPLAGTILLMIAIIAVVEMATMMAIYGSEEKWLTQALIDTTVLCITIVPLIYFFFIKPARTMAYRGTRSEARYKSVIDHAGDSVLIFTENLEIIDCNEGARKKFIGNGAMPESDKLLMKIGGRAVVRSVFQAALKGQATSNSVLETVVEDLTGRSFPAAIRTGLVRYTNTDGDAATEIVVLIRDISKRMDETRRAKDQHNLLQALIEAIPAPIFFKDAERRYLGCNKSFENYLGLSRDKIIGASVYDISPPDLAEKYAAADQALFDGGGHQVYELEVSSTSGERRDMVFHKSVFDCGGIGQQGIVGVMTDITDQKQMERQLTHLTLHDSLTGLPNRACFSLEAEQALARAKRHDWLVAIFFLDLDGFKEINDGYGHAVGDSVLQDTAKKLKQGVRATDFVARISGDEFAVITEDVADQKSIAHIAETLVESVNLPLSYKEGELRISVSLGIAIFPTQGDTVDDLLSKAYEAMYLAKAEGKNRYIFWQDSSADV